MLLKKGILKILIHTFLICYVSLIESQNSSYVSRDYNPGSFCVISNKVVPQIVVSTDDFSGVKKVATHLQRDIHAIADVEPQLKITNKLPKLSSIVIGTLGHSKLIDSLISLGEIPRHKLEGKREKFLIMVLDKPSSPSEKLLIIAGSDKRGTIYGMYSLSKELGVSPWYFWADVPVQKESNLYVLPGMHTLGEPKVKYRGIFINDEAPALTNWVQNVYGGFNSKFYEKVFELILRLKGNYLWPAMWGKQFYKEDSKNAVLANELGIIMGTSHHEPMTRAHAEWQSDINGPWDFNKNASNLKLFWKEGMERAKNHEVLVTVGMRGDGDEPMTEGTAIDLLEDIVNTQRNIISDVTQLPPKETPQLWALYKEVQEYYEKGMEIPDDITLLLCDDNWGNIRKLPDLNQGTREGGYGMYYHFDYVGGPRSYKWINTKQIERVWEQMNLAYEHSVNKVWIVNVGDIKPLEFPTTFFLDLAWNPDDWSHENIQEYYEYWTRENFPEEYVSEISEVLKLHTKYNARRTPELLDENTYSLISNNEAETVVNDYIVLKDKVQIIYDQIDSDYKSAFYQLIYYPIVASCNLHELYYNLAKNKLYAELGITKASSYYKEKVHGHFKYDSLLTVGYHNLKNGKWKGIMSQPHIGYHSWKDPIKNLMPKGYDAHSASLDEFKIIVEGDNKSWKKGEILNLPTFNSVYKNSHYFQVFHTDSIKKNYSLGKPPKWLDITVEQGVDGSEDKVVFDINWELKPSNLTHYELTLKVNSQKIRVHIDLEVFDSNEVRGFVDNNGVICMEASHYTSKFEPKDHQWITIDNLGKTGSSVYALPIEKKRITLKKNGPKLSYDFFTPRKGSMKIHLYFSPTINYTNRKGMYYGLSLDESDPIKVNFDEDPKVFNYNGKVPKHWHEDVSNQIKIITTELTLDQAGNHQLNYYRIDEGLVLQKIVIETIPNSLKESYLGPKESLIINKI